MSPRCQHTFEEIKQDECAGQQGGSMKLLKFAAIACIAFAAQAAFASIINFDDIDAVPADVPLDSIGPYQGLAWSAFSAYTSVPGFQGFNNGIVSSTNAAYSGGEQFGAGGLESVVGTIQVATLLNFSGADFGAGYYDGLLLTVSGLLDGTELFTQTVELGTTGAQHFDFSFTGINELRFTAVAGPLASDPFGCGVFNCTQFTVDNLDVTILPRDPNSVPEPSSLLLAASALSLLLRSSLFRRRAVEPA
jgi:hypothetical protein